MEITADTAGEIQVALKDGSFAHNYQWLTDQIRTLRGLFEKEAKGRAFLYVPPEKAKFFPRMDTPYPFGEKVHTNFPSAQFDVNESAICLACSRSQLAYST
jgi:hypothetical protein